MEFMLSHITRIGVVGGSIYVISLFLDAILDHSLKEAVGALGYTGLLLIVYGAAYGSKKTNDILVSSEAEKRIESNTMANSSTVPAIQREIEKQLTAEGK
jgi:hypothetical protein